MSGDENWSSVKLRSEQHAFGNVALGLKVRLRMQNLGSASKQQFFKGTVRALSAGRPI